MAYGALGGGTFLTQNKVLPGSYINYVSVPRASNFFSDRGYATIGMELDWGETGKIITLEASDLQNESLELLGYSFTDDKMKPLRDLMQGAKTLYLYRLNDEGGKKATATIGSLTVTAKYEGIRGNDIQIIIEKDIDEDGYLVITKMGDATINEQLVKKATELKENSAVVFSSESDELETTVGTKLTGGENGKVVGESHSRYLEEVEKYDFNVIGYAGTDETVKLLYKEFMRRMREDEGVKFQLVLYNMKKDKANHKGLINVFNKVTDDENEAAVVYWVTGQEAGCPINRSLTNKIYGGEYVIDTGYKKREAEQAIKNGYFFFYGRNDEVRVLEDINSFTEFTLYQNSDFSKNQVIRVLDQRAKDIAIIFNKYYLGKVQNNEDGRIGFWNELVKHAETLTELGAIEDYESNDSTVEKGFEKDAIVVHDFLMPVMAMQKLYMTIHVR
ncbi:hypothetical protein ABID14_000213 [Peptoniphilus olsenii]|uniref:Phage tail sheath protein n=1 Tax=Peptoniphilus olsenii TaxID=411570 RepID=A0ABV2J7H7_9FIRM